MELLCRHFDFSFHSATSSKNTHGTNFRGPAVEISLILEGALTFVVDGCRRDIEGPCSTLQVYREDLVVQANRRSAFTRTIWCKFKPDGLSEADWALLDDLPPILQIPTLLPSLFSSAFLLAQQEHPAAQTEFARHSVNFLGKTILSEYIRNASASSERVSLPRPVRLAKHWLDHEFERIWTVEKLARRVGVNANYLIGLFKLHVGSTPMDYLWERRVDVGIHYLQNSQLRIEDVAFRCGFQSAAHFSRRVKQRTGTSPKLLRAEQHL